MNIIANEYYFLAERLDEIILALEGKYNVARLKGMSFFEALRNLNLLLLGRGGIKQVLKLR